MLLSYEMQRTIIMAKTLTFGSCESEGSGDGASFSSVSHGSSLEQRKAASS
jgi:hypothetical protein